MGKFTKRFILFVFLGFAFSLHAQTLTNQQQQTVNTLFANKTEVCFKFNITSRAEINTLTRIISIDDVKNNVVYAYANQGEFTKFLLLNYSYTILPNPNTLQKVKMQKTSSLKGMQLDSWSAYPTYTAYEAIMSQFVTDHPSICKLVNIKTLASGRKLLVLKISDNINVKEDEPEFLYSSSMHGDEVAGYVGMLNYIDYLLTNYGTDPRVTNLVNSEEIWICPLANPDGTYKGGNSTVNGAVRYNANNVDLNRNYPDPAAGQHPDGNAWQPETQAFMGFADTMNFVMSANFHGGAEVVNYPWDTWAAATADNNWWVRESKKYADTAQANGPSGYFTSVASSGYINGYAWYTITGGRQDYMNYFKHCREVTIEISNTKILPATSLTTNFNSNIRSWLNYMEEALHGIRGIVTDSCSGQAVRAKVFISGHDHDSSEVYSALPVGDYHRPIYQGTYNVTYSAPGYQTRTINGIVVTNGNATVKNVLLKPIVTPTVTSTISPTSPSVCLGSTATFNASAVNGGATPVYQWQVNGVNTGTNSSTFSSSSLTNGNVVTCIINSSNICAAGNPATSNSVTVTVNALPTVTVTASSSTVCAGSSVTLSGSGATSYAWSGGITNGVGFVPTSTTTYTVTGTNGNGCTNTATKTITVNPLPTVTVTASSSTVCAGSSVTLSGSGASSYVWTGGVTDGVGFVPTSTTTYTVTGTTASGCSNKATKTITVNPLPTVTVTASSSTVCAGSSVTLSGSGATSYVWSGGITNGIGFVATSTTTYTVTGTNGNGCTNTATKTITVNPLPTVTVTASSSTVCTGSSVTLSGSGATSYAWSGGITNGVGFVPTTTTTYTVTGTGANGCSNKATKTITVSPLPTLTVTASSSTVCAGSSVTLSCNGATSYVWSGGITNGVGFAATSTTTYTVTGTNASGCTKTTTKTITVNPLPTVTVTASSSTVCAGSSVTLSGSGATSYVWSGGITNGVGFIPTSTTTYTVTGTNANGCSKTATKTVTVNPLPTANAGPNYTICPSDLVSITASGNGSFAWSPSTGLSNASISNPVANPSVTTTYTLAVTNSCGTATSVMTITTGSSPSVNAGNNAVVCPGGNTALNASGSSGTYAWSPSAGLSNATIANPVASPTVTTIYTVTLTASCGTATGTVMVTVDVSPTISISGNTSICNGNSISLNASGGTSYVWAPGGQSTVSIIDSPTASTTYTVTGTNANGCTNTALTTVTILAPITNSFTIVAPNCGNNDGTTSALAAGGSGNYNYLWNTTPAQTTATVTGLTGQPTQTLIVTISDIGGCALNDTALVNCVTGIDPFADPDLHFVVFPNPSNGIFNVEGSNNNRQFKIEIYNLFGEKIYQSASADQKSVIDICFQPEGVYFLKIINPDGSLIIKKIIKE